MNQAATWTRLRLLIPLVALLAVVVHASSLTNGFVYDDHWTVEGNPVVGDLANLGRLLGPGFVRDGVPDAARPAFLASVMVDRAIAHRAGAAHAFVAHAQNVALHALVSVALLLLLVRLSFERATACFAAALFAVHPGSVEVVAVVSYREDLLAAAGVLGGLTLLSGVVGDPPLRRAARLLVAGLLMVLAALAKESAYVAPILLATLELWTTPTADARRRWRASAVVAAVAVVVGWRVLVLGRADVVSLGAEVPADVAWPARVATGCATLLRATLRFVSLRGYAPEYATSWERAVSPAAGALAVVTVVTALVLAWRARARWPGITLGVAFAFVAYLPTIGVVPITNLEADRYLYLSAAGLCLAVADAFRRMVRAFPRASTGELLGVPRPVAAAIAFVALVAARTPGQTAMWHDDLRLWTRGVERQPLAPRAWTNLAAARLEAGDTMAALAAAERSLRLADLGGTRALMGLIRLRQGDVAGACSAFEGALARTPASSERYADVLVGVGRCELARGNLAAAGARFEQAAAAAPYAEAPVVAAADVLERLGRGNEAVNRLRRYLAAYPQSVVAWVRLAAVLRASGQAEAARAAQERARAR